jgi:predicted transcriptional regulator
MGKTIANLYRYSQVAQAANRRYLDALSLVEPKTESVMEIEKICNRVNANSRVFSGINPVSKVTATIFLAVLNGANHINGFTNASIRKSLFPDENIDDKKLRDKTTRMLAKLRAHKLIAKIPHSFRYKLTPKGIRVMSATLTVKKILLPDAMKQAS